MAGMVNVRRVGRKSRGAEQRNRRRFGYNERLACRCASIMVMVMRVPGESVDHALEDRMHVGHFGAGPIADGHQEHQQANKRQQHHAGIRAVTPGPDRFHGWMGRRVLHSESIFPHASGWESNRGADPVPWLVA